MYKTSVKGTVRLDKFGLRVKPLQMSWLCDSIFNFELIFEQKPLYTKKPLILGGRLVCARAVLFSDKPVPKKMILLSCMEGGLASAERVGFHAVLAEFSSNIVCQVPANRKKVYHTNRRPKN
jgi:hypothetical protein